MICSESTIHNNRRKCRFFNDGREIGSFYINLFGENVYVMAFQINDVCDRGIGYGKKMVRELVDYTRTLPGVKRLSLDSISSLATHVYESAGFRMVRGRIGDDGERRGYMECEL